jgi:hypothetical protein
MSVLPAASGGCSVRLCAHYAKEKLIQLPPKQKPCRDGRLQDLRVPRARNETIATAPLVSVVSEVLTGTEQIFVEFSANRRDCWLCILNEFPRLPLVLALFSSN